MPIFIPPGIISSYFIKYSLSVFHIKKWVIIDKNLIVLFYILPLKAILFFYLSSNNLYHETNEYLSSLHVNVGRYLYVSLHRHAGICEQYCVVGTI